MTIRPCFLVVDQEHASSLSTRKLVLETAKYNVITAYSCSEAEATLERFPLLDAVVINGSTQDPNASRFLTGLKNFPDVKLVVVGEGKLAHEGPEPAVVVDGFDPPKLLAALQALFSAETRQLQQRESELEQEEL